MLNNRRIPYGQINLIIEQIEMDIIIPQDQKFGNKQVRDSSKWLIELSFGLDGKVNAVVMSTGTGGTLAGISMFLKEKNSKIRTVLADPPVWKINFNIWFFDFMNIG